MASGMKKTCPTCDEEFYPKSINHKYCKSSCNISAIYVKKPQKEFEAICKTCNKPFTYLSCIENRRNCDTCNKATKPDNKPLIIKESKFDVTKRCFICDRSYIQPSLSATNSKYCSDYCYNQGSKLTTKTLNAEKSKHRQLFTKDVTNLKLFEFNFLLEKEFAKWFEANYFMFGIKDILDTSTDFPDVLARAIDGRILRIELELYSNNFNQHKHNGNLCDLIICYMKPIGQTHISGVPVIAVYETNSQASDYKQLTDFFSSVIDHCGKTLTELLDKNNITTADYLKVLNK